MNGMSKRKTALSLSLSFKLSDKVSEKYQESRCQFALQTDYSRFTQLKTLFLEFRSNATTVYINRRIRNNNF